MSNSFEIPVGDEQLAEEMQDIDAFISLMQSARAALENEAKIGAPGGVMKVLCADGIEILDRIIADAQIAKECG